MGAIIHFGTDGWRARVDGDFTAENVSRLAGAAGTLWNGAHPGAVAYVGYDTRPQARQFALLAAEVLSGCGLAAMLSDRPIPTPALSWACAQDPRACGALMVTGSHHPNDYLGVKIRVGDGGGGSSDFLDELERAIEPEPCDERGAIQEVDLVTPYLDDLRAQIDADAIASAGLKIVCDPMYGSGCGCLSKVLGSLGVEAAEIHGAGEPFDEDLRPEPIEPWVDDCERTVVECGASAGLVADGDADRLAAVDERGRYVPAHVIIALLIGHLVKNRGERGRVVLNLSSSVLPRRVAKALGCRVTIKPIGFKYIYEEMLKGDVLIGGEEAGGIGIPSHLYERDGILCSLLLCELMAKTGKTLGKLVDELTEHFGTQSYARRDLRLEPEVIESMRMMLPGLNPPVVAGERPCTVSHMDGLRLEFDDESWLLLRPSGTEPVARVYAEASSVERRDELLDAGVDIARGEL